MGNNIIHNKAKHQFEMHINDDSIAFIEYSIKGKHLNLLHAEVPRELRGQGIGKDLVLKSFALIEDKGYTATAYCSYIRAVAMRSDKWKDIIK